MKKILFVLCVLMAGCVDTETTPQPKSISDFESNQQKYIEEKYYDYQMKYDSAINEISKTKIEKEYIKWLNNYSKDSLKKISKWACQVSDLGSAEQFAKFTFASPDDIILFEGIVPEKTPLFDTLSAIPKKSYVFIDGENLGVALLIKQSDASLIHFKFNIVLDSIKVIKY